MSYNRDFINENGNKIQIKIVQEDQEVNIQLIGPTSDSTWIITYMEALVLLEGLKKSL